MPPKQLASLDLRFQGGLVFKAHRLFYHSILGLRVIRKKKKKKKTPGANRGVLSMLDDRLIKVPRGEKMLYSGTDPESYITEYTLVYED